jgi:hypothetical protein
LRFVTEGSLSALAGWGGLNTIVRGKTMDNDLLDAIETSDVAGALDLLGKRIKEGTDPWEIHMSLYPVVQRILNPPFINPHLPKMYGICREFVSDLSQARVGVLVSLEVKEYARRPKMEKVSRESALTSPVVFKDIERALKENDPAKASVLMAAFLDQKGRVEFARRLLLLGSGYLDNSLGHSVSCTAFILLEMLERTDQDPWPALSALANYFSKGRFHTTPAFGTPVPTPPEGTSDRNLLRATSGRGFVNLHHTITRYAIERVRKLLTHEEYGHLVNAWVQFMGDKNDKEVTLKESEAEAEAVENYDQFYKAFSDLKARPLAASVQRMMTSGEDRKKLGSFLIQGLCDQYQGDYDPHYVTGLGSTLWILDRYWRDPAVAANGLYQYLDFFFSGLGG